MSPLLLLTCVDWRLFDCDWGAHAHRGGPKDGRIQAFIMPGSCSIGSCSAGNQTAVWHLSSVAVSKSRPHSFPAVTTPSSQQSASHSKATRLCTTASCVVILNGWVQDED